MYIIIPLIILSPTAWADQRDINQLITTSRNFKV